MAKVSVLAQELSEQIKQIKDEKEIGLNELALLCDINKAQVSKFFNHKINLSVANVLNMIDILGYELTIVPKENEA